MTEHQTETIYARASRLARTIVLDLWPHAEGLGRRIDRRVEQVPAAARVPWLTDETQVAPGDVVAIYDRDTTARARAASRSHLMTAREYLANFPASYLLVDKVTAKTISGRGLPNLLQGWPVDLSDWATAAHESTERYARSARGRDTLYLGPVADIQRRISEHPAFAEWQPARAAAVAQREADLREADEHRRQREEALRPVHEAGRTLNEILGEKAASPVQFHAGGWFEPGWAWMGRGEAFGVYLHGLAALGRLDADQLREALAALATLKAAAKI